MNGYISCRSQKFYKLLPTCCDFPFRGKIHLRIFVRGDSRTRSLVRPTDDRRSQLSLRPPTPASVLLRYGAAGGSPTPRGNYQRPLWAWPRPVFRVDESLHGRLTCIGIESVRLILVMVRRQGAPGAIPGHLAQIEARFHDFFQLLDLLIQLGRHLPNPPQLMGRLRIDRIKFRGDCFRSSSTH